MDISEIQDSGVLFERLWFMLDCALGRVPGAPDQQDPPLRTQDLTQIFSTAKRLLEISEGAGQRKIAASLILSIRIRELVQVNGTVLDLESVLRDHHDQVPEVRNR